MLTQQRFTSLQPAAHGAAHAPPVILTRAKCSHPENKGLLRTLKSPINVLLCSDSHQSNEDQGNANRMKKPSATAMRSAGKSIRHAPAREKIKKNIEIRETL